MSEVHVFASATASPHQADAVRGHLEYLVAESNKEPGVISYRLFEDLAKSGEFYIFETYKDQAAVDAHMASTHFRETAAKFVPLLAGPPKITATKLVA
jgi:quinol monooxygenase YgiN